MEPGPSASQGSLGDSDVAVGHAGTRLYPSDEFINIQHQMGVLRNSNYALHPLVACMRSAYIIMKTDRMRQTDLDCVRRFLRDDLHLGMDRLLQVSGGMRAYADQETAFEALQLLVCLAAAMLEYRQQQAPTVLPELDADMSPLMSVVLSAFNNHKPVHRKFCDAEIPADVIARWGLEDTLEDQQWVEPKLSPAEVQIEEDDMDDMQDGPQETMCWWSHIVNSFGSMQGFEIIVEMLLNPAQVSFNLLNTSLAVLAQVADEATEEAKELFRRVIEPVSSHVLELVSTGSDRLADYGSDRTYNIFQCLANINLPRVIMYACSAEEALPRRRQLQTIMCTFVSKMLDSSSFNKLLSGARECHKMLSQATTACEEKQAHGQQLLQEVCAWMHENQIVQRLLRTGLHHKQYMNEVKGVMEKLTECSELTAEHLDLMWAVTEKEDAYDAVKTHMFDLLAAIASVCQPSQLDMLFAKLEHHQARDVQDTERLLALLESLAEGDTEGKMTDKIVALVWELTIPADAPRQLLKLQTMDKVVGSYLGMMKGQDSITFCMDLVRKCCDALKSGDGAQVPLLRTARELLRSLPTGDGKNKGPSSRERAVDGLEKSHGTTQHLVAAVCDRVTALQEKVAAAVAAAEDAGSSVEAESLAAVKAAAMAELAEGNWTYADIIKEYMMMLKYLACNASIYFEEALAERLWDTLMVTASCGEDQFNATQTFFRGGYYDIGQSAAYFEECTQKLLLEKHLVKQDVEAMPLASAQLTWDIFQLVNVNSQGMLLTKNRPAVALSLQKIQGLDLIWRIYLSSRQEQVADHMRDKLLALYNGPPVPGHPHSFRKALVEELVSHLCAAAGKLDSKPAEAQLAARMVARCLSLANAAVELVEVPTMPPVPAHNRAWRGTPILLEVQRDGSARLRVTSHDNEYIGLLRERLARHMGCSAKNVRMFSLGHELASDSMSVGQTGLRNRATLNAMESPEPNRFTKAPSEYRVQYELSSFAWMFSQMEGLYPLLLRFIDMPGDIASMALELLVVLPTHPALSEGLAAALDGPDKQQQLAAILDASSSSGGMVVDAGEQPQQPAPYQTLYALQALCALLFPTFDEVLLASADREAAAEGSACPSPAAAAPPPGAGQPQGATTASADAAAVAALQCHHHREVQQQEFLHSRGLEVVLNAAHKAAMANSSDLLLRRQLSALLVVLLHNLLDAAQNWQAVPWAAAAVGNSNGPSAMSGAESGAGQPAGTASHAAPASSLVAANGAAVESVSVPMADVPQAADPAGSSAAAGESPDAARQGSKAGATTSDTACHHPSSPAMEVSSPLPGHQQQQLQRPSSRQRQRGGDLPPLPPPMQQQQQQHAGTPGSHPAAAGGPSLATLFSSHALKIMADTLLGVAVDTSQLWGSANAAAAALPDDENSKDVSVARDALQLLLRLLEHHPPLIQPLLLDVERPPLVCTVLLSPYYSTLRRQAGELLERLVNVESNRLRLLPWLLAQLAATRSLAQQRPASCAEFYQLLASMLMKLSHSGGVLPEQLFAIANAMLDEEVAALQAMAAAGPAVPMPSPISKQLQQRRRRRRPQPANADDSGEDEEQPEPASSTLLQGRLHLVLALVRVLDRRAVGSEGQGALMKLLLQEFLFPEAVQKVAAAAGRLDLQRCAASLEPHCSTPSCRKAALELLAELMGDTPSSLEEGVNMLLTLHYRDQVLRSFNLVPRLLRGPGQYAGLRNGGATCYMNAVFQQLFMQPGIRARILGSAEVPAAEKEGSVFAQLQGLFAYLALTKSTFANPVRFWNAFKDYDGSPIDVREHQDAYEFFTRLQDFVDQHLISTGQQPAIKPVMGGTFVQQIICRGHDFTSERNEDFYQISVEVKGMGTLQKSLDDYVKGELMEGDNAYLCEELGKRVPAVKRTAIRTLPQLLCVHLKRFEFDYHNQTRHKLRDRFEFPVELDMFPYTAEGLAAADQQQKAAEEQQQGQGQQRQLRGSSSSGAAAAAGGQSSHGSNPAYMYDLHGVVVHSGSAFTGHYYSYIKERPGSGGSSGSSSSSSAEAGPRWYCFDDKDVSPWDEIHLEADCFGGKASQDYDMRQFRPQRNEYERAHSAYMLFYERRAAPAEGSTGAGCSSSTALQQQAQQGGTAAGDGDVDMVAGDTPQPAAAAVGAGGSQQQLQPRFSIPYSMPESLFREIIEQNITLIWSLHVLDKDYFRFVRQLVDSRGDLGQLTTRKSRRRDGAAAAAPGVSLAAVASGSSDRVHSGMICDTSTPQQQQQPCPSTGSGAHPMQVSPSPTPVPSAAPLDSTAAAAPGGAGALGLLDVPSSSLPPGADMQQSPGPSSRRGEEAEAVAQALMHLGVLFQFEVYLRAHDGLRGESNVWTEALTSLMASGSSSTACMQVFLDLVQSHPDWLRTYLVDCGSMGQNSPRRWASDMLVWTLTAASKRCARQLQGYVNACLTRFLSLAQDAAAGNMPVQQLQHYEQELRAQWLPPLGQALVGVVQQLVQLVRSCLPQLSQVGQCMLEHDIPSEPARVLLAYAESSPWAAAHLLQVVNIAPDLAAHINEALGVPDHDDLVYEELAPLYDLLDEVLSYASNLPQLATEATMMTHPARRNPYLRELPGSGNASTSSSGSSGSADPVALAVASAAGGVHSILSQSAHRKLLTDDLMRGLAHNVLLVRPRSVHLVGLLTYSNAEAARLLMPALAHLLWGLLNHRPHDLTATDDSWEDACRCASAMLLQPDEFLSQRVNFWAFGSFDEAGQQSTPSRQPNYGVLQYESVMSYPALHAFLMLGIVIKHFKESRGNRAARVLAELGRLVSNKQQKLSADLQQLMDFFRSEKVAEQPSPNLKQLEEVLQDLQLVLQYRQQQQQAEQAQHLVLLALQQQVALQQAQQQHQQQQAQDDAGDEEVQAVDDDAEEGIIPPE